MSRDVVMGQACYMALVRYGYPDDPHTLMNHTIVSLAKEKGMSITAAIALRAQSDEILRKVWDDIPVETRDGLDQPEKYIGEAIPRTRQIVALARETVCNACCQYHIEL